MSQYDPDVLPPRFRAKFRISTTRFYNGTPCWEWTACKDHVGHGRYKVGGRFVFAHRFSYARLVADIPLSIPHRRIHTGVMTVDHLCRNEPCVNPAHLDYVTIRENLRRGRAGSTINAAKTHCIHGHQFTPENTYTYMGKHGPKRQCIACKRTIYRKPTRKESREYMRRYRERKRREQAREH